MKDHLWIALWAVCMVVAALIGQMSSSGAAAGQSGLDGMQQRGVTAGEIAWIAGETCLLLITAALVRRRSARTRLFSYFVVLALLALLFASGGGPGDGRAFWHFLELTLGAGLVLVLAASRVLRGRRGDAV